MPDARVEQIIKGRMPRMMASGVDYNDVQTMLGRIEGVADWMPVWEDMAAFHEALGDAALTAGNRITAGEAFNRAALYFHTGQAVYFDDAHEKARVQTRQRAAYAKAAPLLRPAAQIIEVPFEDYRFAANLRLPEGPPAPCVLLSAGADSTKEEFHTLENEFLRRGIATCSYDGPGQSLTFVQAPLRPDFEKPVGAVIDVLQAHPGIDGARIGIWGRSFGGYTAPRGALDPRIRACTSIGGVFDFGDIWDRFPEGVHEALTFGFGATSRAHAAEIAKTYTLKGVLERIACPLLIVHSGQDTVCPVAESERMRDAAGAGAELVVYPEGNHVCDNIPYKARPLMADWMAAKLSA